MAKAKRQRIVRPSSKSEPTRMLTVGLPPTEPVTSSELAERLGGVGFDRVQRLPGSTYKDSSTVIIVPSRDEKFHHRVVASWQNLISPMNQKRTFMYVVGDEVGVAYNRMIQEILNHPELSKWKYVLTLEADNLPPPDAHIRLLESIDEFRFDAVSGIYFTKGDVNMPMAYGDPAEYKRTGVLEFKPRDTRDAIARGRVMAVNGIAMGCALWRMDLFRQIAAPWFVTVADVVEGKGVQGFTQDLYFCQRAVQAGKTFGVDFRCRVGHLDLVTGTVY